MIQSDTIKLFQFVSYFLFLNFDKRTKSKNRKYSKNRKILNRKYDTNWYNLIVSLCIIFLSENIFP